MMRVCIYPVLLLISILLFQNNKCLAGNFPDNNNIVAKYEYDSNHTVTFKELDQYVRDWLYYKKFQERSDIYNNALNDMLTNQLKRIDFFEKGLDKNDKLMQRISRVISEEMISEYFETQYVGKYANEEYAKKVYGLMDKEVIYQLISLNKPENASQKQLDSLKEKALAIKSEIDNGKDFNTLVKEYSQDKISKVNNGNMPPVDWKRSISEPVGNVIFNLNKNDIRILDSDNALLIVKVTAVNEIQVAPFDSIKSDIISELKVGYLDASAEEYDKDRKELIDETSLEWNESALEQIAKWSNIPKFYEAEYKNTFNDAIKHGVNKTILTYNKGKLDYKEYLRLLDNVLIMGKSDTEIKKEDIKKFILEALRADIIVKKAESLNLKKNILNAFTTNPVLKSQLVYLYNQAEVEARIPEATDKALQKFYKENENTLYYQLEKRNLFVMVFPAKEDAEKASAKIKSGTPFEKATGAYLVKTYIKERNGEIKSFLKNEKPIFSKVGFEMKESEVSEPVEFLDENNITKYAIIKCYNIRPEKQLTFEDVKNTITEDYKNYHRKIIENSIEEKLKNKYHPVINEDVLTKIISAGS